MPALLLRARSAAVADAPNAPPAVAGRDGAPEEVPPLPNSRTTDVVVRSAVEGRTSVCPSLSVQKGSAILLSFSTVCGL